MSLVVYVTFKVVEKMAEEENAKDSKFREKCKLMYRFVEKAERRKLGYNLIKELRVIDSLV